MITPSTTQTGALFPLIVELPRMRMTGVLLGSPDCNITDIPGILPCSIWSKLMADGVNTSFIFTVDMAAADSLRLKFWYPVTTTSSIAFESSSITTILSNPSLNVSVTLFIPKYEKMKSRFSCPLASNLNSPSTLVTTPCFASTGLTDTPITGMPC